MRLGDQVPVSGDDPGRGEPVVRVQGPQTLTPMSLIPSSTMTSRTPGWSRASRAKRASRWPRSTASRPAAVAADSLVDHRERRARHRVQPAGQVVGPALVAADGRLHPVRDRVAERDQGPAALDDRTSRPLR